MYPDFRRKAATRINAVAGARNASDPATLRPSSAPAIAVDPPLESFQPDKIPEVIRGYVSQPPQINYGDRMAQPPVKMRMADDETPTPSAPAPAPIRRV